jgi:hypothetical protein
MGPGTAAAGRTVCVNVPVEVANRVGSEGIKIAVSVNPLTHRSASTRLVVAPAHTPKPVATTAAATANRVRLSLVSLARPRRRHQAIHRIKNGRPLVGHPEPRLIATGTFVVQNSGRLVIVFLGISHQQIGQIVENEPLFVVIDRGDHMVKMVLSIVHGYEPNVVCGESSRASRRILSDGIRLAIAISHGDCFKRTGPVARRGLDHKINRSIEVPKHGFALILACLLDDFHERGY